MSSQEYDEDLRNASIKILNQIKGITKLQVKDLEIGIFNASIDYSKRKNIPLQWESVHFKNVYKNKLKKVYLNINPKSYIKNTTLLKRLKNKEFTPHEIPYMRSQNMFPEKWEEIIELNQKKEIANIENKTVPMTDRFTCSFCHSKKTSYYEMQTRSADEPTTIFITCLNCGKKWRQ